MREDRIRDRIKQRDARVAVIGGGYVGLPLAVRCARVGHRTVVIDPDLEKVRSILAGRSYIGDVSDGMLSFLVSARPAKGHPPNLTAVPGAGHSAFGGGAVEDADVVLICVPTPLNKTKDPDVTIVMDVVESVRREVEKSGTDGPLVVLESTVYPGFTRSAVAEPLGDLGCSVAFSPERIDPGNRTHHLQNTPKLVGGADRNAGELAAEFYRSIVDEVHVVSSCEVAEAAKVLENTFRMVNIALANEMALICQRLEISANEVIDAAATKPFGFMPFRPGPGTGGHCIPVDPHYLSWKLRTLNYHSRLIDLASQINSQMPEHIVSLVSDALNGRRLPVSGSRILVLGLAYKPDIADTRESPAIDIVRLLRAKGALVEIADPHVSSLPPGMEAPSEILNPGRPVEDYDCVVVATDHSRFDWADICSRARLVVDARNALKSLRKYHPDKIVSL